MTEQHFFNLHDMSQGIARALAEGLDTRIFPGENVILSVVRGPGPRAPLSWTFSARRAMNTARQARALEIEEQNEY
jgi:hypothetical protein